jgi:hypothetical protein
VIYPILDGNIYFLDLETGKPTRDKIKLGFSVKGTGMVDPRGYPLFYTGMGLNENNGKYTDFKYRIYSLLTRKRYSASWEKMLYPTEDHGEHLTLRAY